jgi:hypothetical protein
VLTQPPTVGFAIDHFGRQLFYQWLQQLIGFVKAVRLFPDDSCISGWLKITQHNQNPLSVLLNIEGRAELLLTDTVLETPRGPQTEHVPEGLSHTLTF